jgi:hypothetical protein
MEPHWNNALGAYVRNRREFEDGLKRRSDEASERTGTEHRFVPVEWVDAKDAGRVTDEGLDKTEQAAVDLGQKNMTRRTFS